MTSKTTTMIFRGLVVLAILLSVSYLLVMAQEETPPTNYYRLETITLDDGTRLDKMFINGPPKPPPGFEAARQPVDVAGLRSVETAYTIPGVPAFDWVMGCTATSAAMIAGYYDRTAYPNMYTGPANGGVVPLDNSIWGTWMDGAGDTYGQTPLSATRQGLDGRSTFGHIDDYWVEYDSSDPDPFIGNWTEHTYGESTGDYMKTNQSTYLNVDGSTWVYGYDSSTPLTCSDMEFYEVDDEDGTYGWKLFYESRGYTVTTCYNQKTDNQYVGGFSFDDYKAEIDAGRPVMIHVEGHTMVGVGYDDVENTVYLHDTWDYATHSMTWGGTYGDPPYDMEMISVSIVHLEPGEVLEPPTLNPIDNTDGDGNYWVDWTEVTGAITYTLQEDVDGLFIQLTNVYTDTLNQHEVTDQNPGTYYYRVMASNQTLLSEWSNVVSTTVELNEVFVPLVLNYSQSSGGWVDIMTEDFEGDFPGDWELVDYGDNPGDYLWGKRNCLPYEGEYSGWAVGGGDGIGLPCGSDYPLDVYTWMVYGPFSLATAQEAELNFMYWLNTELTYDVFFWGASIDGTSFNGFVDDGYSGGWVAGSLDLTDVYNLGDLTGQDQVWIGFVFASDYIFTEPYGVLVDNIVLRQCETNCPLSSNGKDLSSLGLQYKTFHIER
jgi:hypothetical protein